MTHDFQTRPRHAHPHRRAHAIRRLVTLGCAGALLGACDEGGSLDAAHDDIVVDRSGETTPMPEPTTDGPICPADRVVALLADDGTCPASRTGLGGTWTGGPLFAGDGLPDALAGVCGYRWHADSAPPAPAVLTGSGLFSAVGKDCEVVWPQGDALSDELAGPLRATFYTHAGRVDVGLKPAGAAAPVVVALPDTAPELPGPMTSDHAPNMDGIITSLACPVAAGCTVQVQRHLALPLVEGERDPLKGGYYGSQAQLAQAIHAAVASWKLKPAGTRLVINMSVGWEASRFGGGEAEPLMPAPVQAVHRALQYARCQGAVIITAAGNTAGNECVPGPLAPAMWEDVAGPSRARCNSDFGGAPPGLWDPSTGPLVHAVAGVAHDDHLLANARPGSRPRLVAPGHAAVADGDVGPTSAMTGSSVAAATVSGIAGLVWSYNPQLDPGALMARIHASGAPLTPAVPAQFGVPGQTRRASACAALAHGCTSRCPAAACPATTVDVAALAIDAQAAVATINGATPPPMIDRSTATVAGLCDAGCEQGELFTMPTTLPTTGDVCEGDLYGGHDRYTNPQPSVSACRVCFWANDTVNMTVESDYHGAVVTSALLTLFNVDVPEPHRLGNLGALWSDRATELRLAPTRLPAVTGATLQLTFASGETRESSISVY